MSFTAHRKGTLLHRTKAFMFCDQLPVGAIRAAQPLDVVKATKTAKRKPVGGNSSPSNNRSNIPSRSGQRDTGKETEKMSTKSHPEGDIAARNESLQYNVVIHTTSDPTEVVSLRSTSSSSVSTLSEETSGDSSIVEVSLSSKLKKEKEKEKKAKKKTRGYHKENKAGETKSNGKGKGKARLKQNAKKLSAQTIKNVPMKIEDTRCEVQKVVEAIIDDHPVLKELTQFEEGSIPDFIDRIGVTREEAFARFPREQPNLPLMPGRTVLSILDMTGETRHGEDQCGSREKGLAEALELECRRADLLAYQVKMLRGELVQSLKRWQVLTTVMHCMKESKGGELEDVRRLLDHETLTKALDQIETLGMGKVIKILTDKMLRRSTKGRRKRRRGGALSGDRSGSGGYDSPTSSSGSSTAWSSASSDKE
jgi:hypothetical protein